MAKSQVSFEKRRREVDKKRKAEEKRDRRKGKKDGDDSEPTGYNYASSDQGDDEKPPQ